MPRRPTVLPPPMAAFLRQCGDYAVLTSASTIGTVLIVKAPAKDIASCGGRVPIAATYELHNTPYGPVLRTVLTVYDEPATPLKLETFFNPSDPVQLDDAESLLSTHVLRVLFFDGNLVHRLTKTVRQEDKEEKLLLVPTARQLLLATPPDRLDFDRAKAIIQAENPL